MEIFFVILVVLIVFPKARKRFFEGLNSHLRTGSTNWGKK